MARRCPVLRKTVGVSFLEGFDLSVFNKSTDGVYNSLLGHLFVFTLNVKINPIFYKRLVSCGFRKQRLLSPQQPRRVPLSSLQMGWAQTSCLCTHGLSVSSGVALTPRLLPESLFLCRML